MIDTIAYLYRRVSVLLKLPKLDIEKSGIDNEGDPYVKLKDGLTFYGVKSKSNDKKFYKLMPSTFKEKVIFECFKVASDIIIRYVEGGLKYLGPKKNHIYDVKKGDSVVEMGAYMGYFSMKMSEIVGSDGKVLGIEPMPNNFRILEKNIKRNNLTNCVIINKGVYNKTDVLEFSRTEGDNQSGSALMLDKGNEKLKIPVDCLDNLLEEGGIDKCNQMVIQLNGVEIEALEGLNKVIPDHFAIAARYDRPKVDTIKTICDMLSDKGCKPIVVKERYIFAEKK